MGVQSDTVHYIVCDGCGVRAAYGTSSEEAETLARQRGMVSVLIGEDTYHWFCSMCAYTKTKVSVRTHARYA